MIGISAYSSWDHSRTWLYTLAASFVKEGQNKMHKHSEEEMNWKKKKALFYPQAVTMFPQPHISTPPRVSGIVPVNQKV